MFPQGPRGSMPWLRQIPQLRQIPVSDSNARHRGRQMREVLHLGGGGAFQPIAQFTFTKSPLPADFDCRDDVALRPEADGARGNAEPFGDCGGGEQRLTLGYGFFY